jgi:hypothetical protein
MTVVQEGMSRDTIKEKVFEVIRKESEKFDSSLLNPKTPISEGPFPGIADLEWTLCDLGNLDCRIRVIINREGEVVCSLSPLSYSPIESAKVNPVRVDSCDRMLGLKTPDWFVPGIEMNGGRDRTLLVNELDEITESGIANIAVYIGGEWITPDDSSVLLNGCLRQLLIDRGFIVPGQVPLLGSETSSLWFNSVRGVFTVSIG